MSIYDFALTRNNGESFPLGRLKGKVLLIVNTATGCGFTPQYKGLERLYEDLLDEGKPFEIIDIPCNQFGHQAPGSDASINQFCTLSYATTFLRMKKSDVNGENELPLYAYLKSKQGFHGFGEGESAAYMHQMLLGMDADYAAKPDIKWNFTKFVISAQGDVIARFEPTEDLREVEACIRSLF